MADPAPTKLIQTNVWHWRLAHPMRRFLAREAADIICAQESLDRRANGYYSAEELLADGLAKTCVHGPQVPNDTYHIGKSPVQRQINVAIFSQLPVTDQQVVSIAGADDVNHVPPAYHSLLHATILVQDRPVNVLTYHGRLVYDGRMGSDVTTRDFEKIAAYINALDGPTIFTGDFNLAAAAPPLQGLKPKLENLIERYSITKARNDFAWKPDEAVSHVFISPDINVHSFTVAADIVSDHQALVLEFAV